MGTKTYQGWKSNFVAYYFLLATSGPVPRTQKIMSQQCVDLLIADVGVLRSKWGARWNEGVRPEEIIDSSLTTENIGINVQIRQKEDIFCLSKTVKLKKNLPIYDKLNN